MVAMAAILDFRCFLSSFKSVGLSVQEKKIKIYFKDGGHCGHGGHLAFQIGTMLAIVDYKSPHCFLPTYKSIGLLFRRRSTKIDFQDGGHLEFPIGTILAISYLQVIPMLPTKFQVNWSFVQEKKRKKYFQDGRHGGHLGFPIQTILNIFDLQVTAMLPTKF